MKKNKLATLEDLYVHELKDIYNAEKQLTKALPKLAKAASSQQLKTAFEEHLEETQNQISRLDQIFERLGQRSTSTDKCDAMEGLIKEGDKFIKEEAAPAVHDAGLIVGAQKVEHYEIAAYGSLCTFAEILNFEDDLNLLKENLSEEEAADEKLSQLAESGINEAAEVGAQRDFD
jgi:ferritin-like metal-binding protein YciE